MTKRISNEIYNKRVWKKTSLATAVSAGIMASVITTPIFANEKEKEIEVIMVTSTKSSESIQTVPLALTALSGNFMEDVRMQSTKDLISYTPGITGKSGGGFIDSVSIRGIRTQDFGVGGDPSAGFFKNDLYEGRNGSVVSSFFDMDRAEIARGPQGFLFGRNAVSGAVSVHTKRAELDVLDGFVDVGVAENSKFQVSGGVNIPVSENFAMRVAGLYNTEESFVDNTYDGGPSGDLSNAGIPDTETLALRLSTTYENDGLNIYTMVEYEDNKGQGSSYRAIEEGEAWDVFETVYGPITINDNDPYAVNQDQGFGGPQSNTETLNFQLRVEKELGFADLTVTAGYKDHDFYYSEDYDGTPLPLSDWDMTQSGDYSQIEARLNSTGDSALGWYVGASYYKENLETAYNSRNHEERLCEMYSYDYTGYVYGCSDYANYNSYTWTPSPDGYLHEPNNVTGEFQGWATYLNLNYDVTEALSVELGVRYTSDEKYLTQNVPQTRPVGDTPSFPCWFFCYSTEPGNPLERSETWDNTSFKAVTKYQVDDDMMVFASWTEGYKSGGFSTFLVDDIYADPLVISSFEPETVDSYEIGLKDTWFDGRVRVDLTAFTYKSVGAQVIIPNPDGAGTVVLNTNTEGQGFEAAINADITENWNIIATTAYLDTSIYGLGNECGFANPADCEGSPAFWAPTWSHSFVLDGQIPLESGDYVGIGFETTYESSRGRGFEDLDESEIGASIWSGARIAYESGSESEWYVELYVDNLFDERTWAGMNNLPAFDPTHFWGPSQPRTAGIRFGTRWGD
jgi:iron complex outermembrane receptor protein